jgi:excisionase family DNA binding protein
MSTNIYEEKRRALSIRETARTCGLSRATLYRLLKDGKLCTVKVGARRLVAYLEGVSQGEAARRLARMLGLEIGGVVMDDALEKSSAVAAGQMFQAPEQGDESHRPRGKCCVSWQAEAARHAVIPVPLGTDGIEERAGLAADRVPARYLDTWARLQCQRPGDEETTDLRFPGGCGGIAFRLGADG